MTILGSIRANALDATQTGVARKMAYEDAKRWAQGQFPRIAGAKQWRELSKRGLLPKGMPAWPQGYYGTEFESWGEFLGTGTIAATKRAFWSYEKAKAWAQSQTPAITSRSAWQLLAVAKVLPDFIPADPRNHYGEQFEGWGIFLGTGFVANQNRVMVSYEEAKSWVKEQRPVIHSRSEYQKRVRESRRKDLPQAPWRTYAGQFEGWPTFLGTRKLASTSMMERMIKHELAAIFPIDQSAVTRLIGENGRTFQVDIYIPSYGLAIEYDGAYFHLNREAEDRVKTCQIEKGNPGVEVLRMRVQPLALLGPKDFSVPSNSNALEATRLLVSHLLDMGAVRPEHIAEARKYALGLLNPTNWQEVAAKWRSFEEARAWARQQGLASRSKWMRYAKQATNWPQDIPISPDLVYAHEFLGWPDFLGTDFIPTQRRVFQDYTRAMEWARVNGVKTSTMWAQLSSSGHLPKDLPAMPQVTYKQYWEGWGTFLGTGKAKDRAWADLAEITRWCHAQTPAVLSPAEWSKAKNRDDFPQHFPKSLHYHLGVGVFEKIRHGAPEAGINGSHGREALSGFEWRGSKLVGRPGT